MYVKIKDLFDSKNYYNANIFFLRWFRIYSVTRLEGSERGRFVFMYPVTVAFLFQEWTRNRGIRCVGAGCVLSLSNIFIFVFLSTSSWEYFRWTREVLHSIRSCTLFKLLLTNFHLCVIKNSPHLFIDNTFVNFY